MSGDRAGGHGAAADHNGERPRKSWEADAVFAADGGFCDVISKPILLLYDPPYHSKYHPIERCWGIRELHWNGTKLVEVETMVAWAKSRAWKGIAPIVELSRKVSHKGVALSKRAMQVVEARLMRHSELPKWDILILPTGT